MLWLELDKYQESPTAMNKNRKASFSINDISYQFQTVNMLFKFPIKKWIEVNEQIENLFLKRSHSEHL